MITSYLLKCYTEIHHGFGEKSDKAPDAFQLKQVHSNQIHVVTQSPLNYLPQIEGDAIVTQCAQVAIGIRTADCLPILIYDPDSKVIAAVHAGWRGTEQKIVQKTIEKMQHDYPTLTESLRVVLGPCIQTKNYEVDQDVERAFHDPVAIKSQYLLPAANHKWHLDLQRANFLQLEQVGVLPDHIDILNHCTFGEPNRFHSYRRNKSQAGRQLSFIEIV
jgi:polyphenol oxidase